MRQSYNPPWQPKQNGLARHDHASALSIRGAPPTLGQLLTIPRKLIQNTRSETHCRRKPIPLTTLYAALLRNWLTMPRILDRHPGILWANSFARA